MISDFIDEHSGLLSLTDEEYERAKQVYPSAKIYSCRFLEYGENREDYWICDKFIDQINSALETAELKYPKEEGCRHVWVFDHSSCHAAMVDNTLIANKMNRGKQRKMRNTVWRGMVQSLNDSCGVPKGMRQVLRQRHVDVSGMTADQMRSTLAAMDDFKNETSLVQHLLIQKGHIPAFLSKFQPQLNPIEREWAQIKRYIKVHCKMQNPVTVK